MQLPFTRDQFLDLFLAYNEALWPALVALWIGSAVISARLLAHRQPSDRSISVLLAVHWLWAAVAYLGAFFTRINPVAWAFAGLFSVQATLLYRVGVVQHRLVFAASRDGWTVVAWLLIVYSLLYPAINAVHMPRCGGFRRSVCRVRRCCLPLGCSCSAGLAHGACP